jgi:hypothetical protein
MNEHTANAPLKKPDFVRWSGFCANTLNLTPLLAKRSLRSSEREPRRTQIQGHGSNESSTNNARNLHSPQPTEHSEHRLPLLIEDSRLMKPWERFIRRWLPQEFYIEDETSLRDDSCSPAKSPATHSTAYMNPKMSRAQKDVASQVSATAESDIRAPNSTSLLRLCYSPIVVVGAPERWLVTNSRPNNRIRLARHFLMR